MGYNQDLGRYRDKILSGSIVKTLLWLGLPILAVQLVNISYNLVDAYWLSRYSPVYLSVPPEVWPSFMMFQAFIMGLSSANMAQISQYIGAERYDDAKRVIRQFFTFSILFAIVFGSSFYILKDYIYRYLMVPPSEIINEVITYSNIIALDLFTSHFVIFLATILQSAGDTRSPAIVNAISAFMNMILDPIMILGLFGFPRMGVAGAAIATVISRAIGALTLLFIVRRKYRYVELKPMINIDRNWLFLTFRIGIPVTLQSILISSSITIQNRLVNSFGIVPVTAMFIGMNVMNLVNAFLFGLTMPISIMIGQTIGAENFERVKRVAKVSQILMFTISLIGSIIAYVVRGYIINAFLDAGGDLALSIYREAETFLSYLFFTIPFFSLFMVSQSIGRGSGHITFPIFLDITSLLGIRIAIGYILSRFLGPTGLWIAFAIGNTYVGILGTLWVLRFGWVKPIIKKIPIKTEMKTKLDRVRTYVDESKPT